jgi:hypothetical protein
MMRALWNWQLDHWLWIAIPAVIGALIMTVIEWRRP